MNSLFFKIFIWFWLAMTLAGVILLALEAERARRLTERWRNLTGDAFATYAVTSARALEAERRSDAENHRSRKDRQLGAYLQELEQRTQIEADLLDEQGRLLAGATWAQPEWMRRRMQRLAQRARRSGKTEFDLGEDDTLLARVAAAPSGRRYILIGHLPAARQGLWVPGPRLQALRLLAVLLAAALVCWGLGRQLTAPIVALRGAARRLAAGELSARAATQLEHRHDELADLARDFDRMAERIETLLTEQKRLMAAQRRLLGDVSHELRSPLARVSVALEMARDRLAELHNHRASATTDVAPVAGRRSTLGDALERIERETIRLNELIDRLLTLSRLESGVKIDRTATFDLTELARSVAADAAFEARPDRYINVVLECDNCRLRGARPAA
jgi:two-component system sensor histidine kinase CpxA